MSKKERARIITALQRSSLIFVVLAMLIAQALNAGATTLGDDPGVEYHSVHVNSESEPIDHSSSGVSCPGELCNHESMCSDVTCGGHIVANSAQLVAMYDVSHIGYVNSHKEHLDGTAPPAILKPPRT